MLMAFDQGGTVITYCGIVEGVLPFFLSCAAYHAVSCEALASTLRKGPRDRTHELESWQ